LQRRFANCAAWRWHLPIGVDLRLLEGDDFRRTKLCKDAPEAHDLADKWHAALIDIGWNTKGVE